jgi:hypothetical protein
MFKKMKLTNRKIFFITLVVVAIHFVLTSAIGYYIAVQEGKQLGKIVTDGLIEVYEKSPQESPRKSEEEAKMISQNMQEKRDEIIKKWEISTILISLPIKHFVTPFLQDLQRERTKKVLSKEISIEQFYTQERLMSFATNLANSFAFGLLIYAIIIIFNRKPKHNKQRDLTRKKPSRKSGAGRG